MILYQIMNKQTGKRFVCGWSEPTFYWNDSGAFWKTIDTVEKHMRRLCHHHEFIKVSRVGSEFEYESYEPVRINEYAFENFVVVKIPIKIVGDESLITAEEILGSRMIDIGMKGVEAK